MEIGSVSRILIGETSCKYSERETYELSRRGNIVGKDQTHGYYYHRIPIWHRLILKSEIILYMRHTLSASLIMASLVAIISCNSESSTEDPTTAGEEKESARYDLALADKLSVFGKLPSEATIESNPLTRAKIKLGHRLFFDTQLSKDGNISCNSCHNLSTFGVDNLPFSPGDDGGLGGRNSPTVLNAALHTSQFWDGRAKDVEEQAGMPILNPVEMAIPNEEFLVNRLSESDEYKKMFQDAFPDSDGSITYERLRLAIAAFERKLITPSRFDKYLSGDMSALTVQEKRGLSSFILNGCTNCHNGPGLGGNSIRKFGERHDYWEQTKSENVDLGVAAETENEADNYMFKVSSLRNVEKTGPYFHDGSVADLHEAIRIMAYTQLDKRMTENEVENISAFLTSLTGEVPQEYQTAP